MSRTIKTALVVAAATSLGACATGTRFTTAWKDPAVQTINVTKGDVVLAMIVSQDESVRRGTEMSLVSALAERGVTAVPSYTVIPTEYLKDKDKAKALVEKARAAGVVVMRVTAKDQQVNSTPGGFYGGPYYGGFWGGYYGYGWGAVYTPGQTWTDTLVYVETLLYDLRSDKLIWAGQSETTNPKRADTLIRDIVSKAAAEMKKQGLVRAAQ
jgi:hypothetical protein